ADEIARCAVDVKVEGVDGLLEFFAFDPSHRHIRAVQPDERVPDGEVARDDPPLARDEEWVIPGRRECIRAGYFDVVELVCGAPPTLEYAEGGNHLIHAPGQNELAANNRIDRHGPVRCLDGGVSDETQGQVTALG